MFLFLLFSLLSHFLLPPLSPYPLAPSLPRTTSTLLHTKELAIYTCPASIVPIVLVPLCLPRMYEFVIRPVPCSNHRLLHFGGVHHSPCALFRPSVVASHRRPLVPNTSAGNSRRAHAYERMTLFWLSQSTPTSKSVFKLGGDS